MSRATPRSVGTPTTPEHTDATAPDAVASRVTAPPRRARVIGSAGLVLLVLITVGAWVAASQARTPAQRATDAEPPAASMVTATVTAGQLIDEIILDGVITRAEQDPVVGPAGVAGAERLVVTALPAAIGDPVDTATVLAEVSGRPVVALAGDFPAYRDLQWEMTGPDVRQLQRALQPIWGTPVTGVFDDRTERDVRNLYAMIGYEPVERPLEPEPGAADPEPPADESQEPPRGSDEDGSPASQAADPPPVKAAVPAGEIAYLPKLPATVVGLRVEVGDDASEILLDIASGDWRVETPVSPATADQLAALSGDERIHFRNGPLDGREASLEQLTTGEAETDEASQAEQLALFAVSDTESDTESDPPDLDTDLAAGVRQEVVVERLRSPDDAVIVPVSALWTAPDGSTVVTVVEGPERLTREEPVEIAVTVAGEAAIRPAAGARLSAGDEVLVAYQEPADG